MRCLGELIECLDRASRYDASRAMSRANVAGSHEMYAIRSAPPLDRRGDRAHPYPIRGGLVTTSSGRAARPTSSTRPGCRARGRARRLRGEPRADRFPRSRPCAPAPASSCSGLADTGIQIPDRDAGDVAELLRSHRRRPVRPSQDGPARTPSRIGHARTRNGAGCAALRLPPDRHLAGRGRETCAEAFAPRYAASERTTACIPP